MKNYVAYYRVSTQQQGKSGLGLEAQKKAVNDFIKEDNLLAEFTEVETGKNDNRIKLAESIELATNEEATLIIAKLEEYFRDESVVIHSNRLIDELFTFIYNNNRAEAMRGYNDDLVMSFAIGLWVRDTALRLRQEGIEITKKTLSRFQDIDGLYTPEEHKNDSWEWDVNQNKESLEWLL